MILRNLLVFDPPRQIIVTGHTDNVPMNNAEFESNWELSVMRAVNFLKSIVKNEAYRSIAYSVLKATASSNLLNRMIQQKGEVKIVGLKYLFNHLL